MVMVVGVVVEAVLISSTQHSHLVSSLVNLSLVNPSLVNLSLVNPSLVKLLLSKFLRAHKQTHRIWQPLSGCSRP